MQLQFLHEIVDDFHYSRQQHSVHKQDLHWTYLCDCCGFFICQTINNFCHARHQHSVHKQDIHWTYPCDCGGFFVCQTINDFCHVGHGVAGTEVDAGTWHHTLQQTIQGLLQLLKTRLETGMRSG